LRWWAGRGSVWVPAPEGWGSAGLRVGVSPIDQVEQLGWEWWRVLSVVLQSFLLFLNAARLFRANLP